MNLLWNCYAPTASEFRINSDHIHSLWHRWARRLVFFSPSDDLCHFTSAHQQQSQLVLPDFLEFIIIDGVSELGRRKLHERPWCDYLFIFPRAPASAADGKTSGARISEAFPPFPLSIISSTISSPASSSSGNFNIVVISASLMQRCSPTTRVCSITAPVSYPPLDLFSCDLLIPTCIFPPAEKWKSSIENQVTWQDILPFIAWATDYRCQ